MYIFLTGVSIIGTLLKLQSEAEVSRARKQHGNLMMMFYLPHDHGCSMALPMFRKAATDWTGPGNMTFATVDVEGATDLLKLAQADFGSLPAYALSISGLGKPVKYRGGWSDKSITIWLRQQAALQPVEVSSVDDLLGFARDVQPSLMVIGFLNAAQRERRLLEVAARDSQVQAMIAHGDEALAAELDAEAPCVVIVRLGATSWPLLRGPKLPQRAVEDFMTMRALPLVIAIGDSERTFSARVRAHPIKLQVLLIHRQGKQGITHNPSVMALREFEDAAASFEGRALFLSYDFFDNDPETFTSHKVFASELPAVLVMHGRGGFEEKAWRVKGGGEHLDLTAASIKALVSKALDRTSAGDERMARGTKSLAPAMESLAPPRLAADLGAFTTATLGAHGEIDGDEDEEDGEDEEDEEDEEEDLDKDEDQSEDGTNERWV